MVRLPRNEKQTYRLNFRAQMWLSGLTLAMTVTLNFQGQIYNLLNLSQKWSDCHETKSKHIDWTPRPQMWPSGLTLAMTLTFEFSRSNVTLTFDHTHDLAHWIFLIKFWNSCISEWEGRLTLHKGGGSRSFITITIWWPRSGEWIYQIDTGVSSVFGVPSTHLVHNENYIYFPHLIPLKKQVP